MDSANSLESSTSWQMKSVTWLGATVNVLLTILQAVVSWASSSPALIADAGHSFSDLLSNVVTLWALMLGRKPKDDNHPYGHGWKLLGRFLLLFSLGLKHWNWVFMRSDPWAKNNLQDGKQSMLP